MKNYGSSVSRRGFNTAILAGITVSLVGSSTASKNNGLIRNSQIEKINNHIYRIIDENGGISQKSMAIHIDGITNISTFHHGVERKYNSNYESLVYLGLNSGKSLDISIHSQNKVDFVAVIGDDEFSFEFAEQDSDFLQEAGERQMSEMKAQRQERARDKFKEGDAWA